MGLRWWWQEWWLRLWSVGEWSEEARWFDAGCTYRALLWGAEKRAVV